MPDITENSALILVDIQNDFCPGGALGVSGGDEVVPVVNALIKSFPFVVASQDWHPSGHISFIERGGPWPPHCVQETHGSQFHPRLDVSNVDAIVRKATSQESDAYSAFEASDESGKALDEALRAHSIDAIFIAGLATDYCVRATALDGIANGYKVFVIQDAVRGVDVNAGDSERALREIVESGGVL